MFYFPCSPVHKICLLFTELNNEDKHIFRDGELRKQSANFKQTQRKQIIYFHVNRYIIWICQRFVKQNKVLRFSVHMKTSHQSTKNVNIDHQKNIAIRIIKINKILTLHVRVTFI